jgi:hypothetical protein
MPLIERHVPLPWLLRFLKRHSRLADEAVNINRGLHTVSDLAIYHPWCSEVGLLWTSGFVVLYRRSSGIAPGTMHGDTNK